MTTRLSAWRAVVGFGVVSLAADMVYEGARSITGPFLASLGASALLVGLVTGAGEAMALVLRLAFGPMADRRGNYWALTILGYGITAVSVPLLAVTPFLGGAGLAVACFLILLERTGKAVRSPSKSTLLAFAAADIGRGRGFGVHKALDQVGSFAGPLAVAGVLAVVTGIWPALAVLVVPGVVAMALLVWLRPRVGDPGYARAPGRPSVSSVEPVETRPSLEPVPSVSSVEPVETRPSVEPVETRDKLSLPREFYMFAASSGAATAGLVTFGVISFHLSREHVVPVATIPVVYAAGMAAAAVSALATGYAYDRYEARVLYTLPFLIAAVPALAFTSTVGTAVIGVLLWGAAVGVQDSTVKALVADLVRPDRRATAYGIFAGIQGVAAVCGGALAGALYSTSVPALVAAVAVIQVVALALFAATQRLRRGRVGT